MLCCQTNESSLASKEHKIAIERKYEKKKRKSNSYMPNLFQKAELKNWH